MPVMENGEQAEGAIPNGAPVEKINSIDTDLIEDGEQGIVLASQIFAHPEGQDFIYLYRVDFKVNNGVPTHVMGHRIRELA